MRLLPSKAASLLSLTTLVLSLTACGGGGDDSNTSTNPAATDPPETAAPLGSDRESALAVAPVAGSLVGRAWTKPQALETGANTVLEQHSAIDDAGHVMVVFKKPTAARDVLYATRGTPGANGATPVFTAPLVIDVRAAVPLTSVGWPAGVTSIGLATAPKGNAVAVWSSKAPCGATTYNTTGSCTFIQTARYLASTGKWESPVQVANSFYDVEDLSINDQGDIALRFTGWLRKGSTTFTAYPAVAWKAAGQIGFSQRVFTEGLLVSRLGLDNAGNLLVATTTRVNYITAIHAYRATVAGGQFVRQTLATGIATGGLREFSVGHGGQQLVLWKTSDNDSSWTAATATSAAAAFTVKRLNWSPSSATYAVVTDAGTALVYDFYGLSFLKWSANQWSAPRMLGAAGSTRMTAAVMPALASNGNFLAVDGGSGEWASYDASRNVFVQPFLRGQGAAHVLGVSNSNLVVGMAEPLLSPTGIGAVTMKNFYASLPSPSTPAGVKSSVDNLWGTYLK